MYCFWEEQSPIRRLELQAANAALLRAEAEVEAIADQVLPKSAKTIFEDFLKGFKTRREAIDAPLQEEGELSRYVCLALFARVLLL